MLANKEEDPVLIRPGVGDDLSALTDLYNHYVRETPVTFDVEPVTPETRLEWLDAHPAAGRHRLLVAESRGQLAGYAGSSPCRPKRDRFDFEPVGVHREVGRTFGSYWDVAWYQKERR